MSQPTHSDRLNKELGFVKTLLFAKQRMRGSEDTVKSKCEYIPEENYIPHSAGVSSCST